MSKPEIVLYDFQKRMDGNKETRLKQNQRIEFGFEHFGSWIKLQVEYSDTSATLKITKTQGADGIKIEPSAGNQIYIH